MSAGWYAWQGTALILSIRVQPRASQNEFAGVVGEQLKVRLTAPPVDGKANLALLKFLAKCCDVPRGQVTLLSGDTGRNKRVRIDNPRQLPAGVPKPGGL
jgi:uncharacterized protein (TIGR00251 family)